MERGKFIYFHNKQFCKFRCSRNISWTIQWRQSWRTELKLRTRMEKSEKRIKNRSKTFKPNAFTIILLNTEIGLLQSDAHHTRMPCTYSWHIFSLIQEGDTLKTEAADTSEVLVLLYCISFRNLKSIMFCASNPDRNLTELWSDCWEWPRRLQCLCKWYYVNININSINNFSIA
jgi:hypothetical protein